MRTPSFVHGRRFVVFAILFPVLRSSERTSGHHNSKCPTKQGSRGDMLRLAGMNNWPLPLD
jgi:hypothetical protein